MAQVSSAIAKHLGSYSDKVYYHHDYAHKAYKQHEVAPGDFKFIFDVVEHGRALADRDRHVTFLHLTERGWFQVTVKRADVSRRLYICTFYKTNLKEVSRKTRKFAVLRKDKWAAEAAH